MPLEWTILPCAWMAICSSSYVTSPFTTAAMHTVKAEGSVSIACLRYPFIGSTFPLRED